MRRRAAMFSLGLAGAALALGGCAGTQSATSSFGGPAARSDLVDIGAEELIAQVQAFQAEINQPVNQPAPGLARATLERMLQDALIKAKAVQLGVKVTTGQVDDARKQLAAQNGGEAGLVTAAQSSGIATSAIDDVVRSNLLVSEIGLKLDFSGDNNARLLAAQKSIGELAAQLHVSVAPRYGVWDDATLSIKEISTTTQAVPNGATASAAPAPGQGQPAAP